MVDSTRGPSGRKARPKKPQKPRPDFPLYAHAAGFWAKKIRGKTVYFTRWRDDPKGKGALEEWLEKKDDLLAGREPRAKTEGLTVRELANEFLAHKEALRDNRELAVRTFRGYHDTCARVVEAFGKNRVVADLTPDDFRKLRTKLAKGRGAVWLRNEMQRVRGIFKFAFDEGKILAPVRFGQGFAKPKIEVIDRARQEHQQEHGARMFEAEEIRRILAESKEPLRAMVLLAANGGLGQTDLAHIPLSALDLERGWLDFARVKTGVPRRIPLWPETVEALREWLPERPKSKDAANARLLFLTVRGATWVKVSAKGAPKDAIAQEFNKVLSRLGLNRARRGFYALRHSFETIGGETADQVAVDKLMGHKIKGMAANYIERIGDDRLRRVVEHVREWLFEGAEDPEDEPGKKNSEICDPCGFCDPRVPPEDGAEGSENREEDSAGRKVRTGRKITDKVSPGDGTRLRLFVG